VNFRFFDEIAQVAKIPEAKGVLISLGQNSPISLLFELEGKLKLTF